MVTLTGAEAVKADGIAAADDPCDGWARRCRDRSADRGDGTGRKQYDQHGTSHNGSLDSRSRPHEFLHSLTGRAPRMASWQDASRGKGTSRPELALRMPVFGTPASEQKCPVRQPFVVDNIGLLPGAHQPGGCAVRSGRAISWHRLSPADHGEHPRGPI
jgi:hypothetical protein